MCDITKWLSISQVSSPKHPSDPSHPILPPVRVVQHVVQQRRNHPPASHFSPPMLHPRVRRPMRIPFPSRNRRVPRRHLLHTVRVYTIWRRHRFRSPLKEHLVGRTAAVAPRCRRGVAAGMAVGFRALSRTVPRQRLRQQCKTNFNQAAGINGVRHEKLAERSLNACSNGGCTG